VNDVALIGAWLVVIYLLIVTAGWFVTHSRDW
jgi:hypothetical protein